MAIFHQFDFVVWLLSHLPALGLWVILCLSPMLRHMFWYFSTEGRKNPAEKVPKWISVDFELYLMNKNAAFTLLREVLRCQVCQGFHVGWMAGLTYALAQGLPLWYAPVTMLMSVPTGLVSVKILSKI